MTLETILSRECIWEKLKHESRPIVLYGTGNGGDKMIDALEQIGRKPAGVFASDGFVRHRTFRDMPVLSHDAAVEQFGEDMVVLVAFGSPLPEVMENIRRLDAQHPLYIPELPLMGETLFTADFCRTHRTEIETVCGMMADEESRALFTDMLLYRLSGELRYLSRTEPFTDSLHTLIRRDTIHTIIDGGAFIGDSARALLSVFTDCTRLIAVEPDARTFRKLSAYAETTAGTVVPYHGALCDRDGITEFISSGSRGSGISGTNHRAKVLEVPTLTVDTLSCDTVPDLIKLDVEGSEAEALRGAEATIRNHFPALLVSLYHRAEDLFALPLQIESIAPNRYNFYLRRVPCYPAWDLMLYALPYNKHIHT